MRVPFSLRILVKSLAIALAVALPLLVAAPGADARIGGGFSSGSRGARTFAAPPSTTTAPNAARPFDRTATQPSTPGLGTGMGGGFFGRPGLMGGLMAGFLGAGLFGMLFGGGLFGGLGGLSSLIGLVLQIGLIVIVARLVMSWWRQRNVAYAGAPPLGGQAPAGGGGGFGFGIGGGNSAPLTIGPDDYDAFEHVLGDIQAAWSNEDVGTLQRLATPEMVSYFTRDLAANQSRGVVNRVSNVKLLQGDLSEAWREGAIDFATVAMRYSLVDKTLDRHVDRLVEGSDTPEEVTEVWTFQRDHGGPWRLSAIQQV
jgi:predicted lipid-binding transport protein (Tim44 family)